MKPNQPAYASIDAYIAGCSEDVREVLSTLRSVIKEAAPEAGEKIGYAMPTFTLHGNLVHFAAFKNHIGFYPAPSGIQAFRDELTEYKCSKGAIQFPLNKPLPYELVGRIVRFRAEENIRLAVSGNMKSRKKESG